MASSGIASILRSLREIPEPIHVQGASAAARALIVSRLQQELTGPAGTVAVVLCASDDEAAEFASDVESLALRVNGDPITVCHLPTWEQSPYSPIAPSIRSRLARIAALSSLGSQVIVTTIAAACQATIPQDLLRR